MNSSILSMALYLLCQVLLTLFIYPHNPQLVPTLHTFALNKAIFE